MKRIQKIEFVLIGIVLVVFLSGCNGRPPVSNTTVVNDLVITMWISNPCVQPGDTVHLRATVVNEGTTIEVVDLRDNPVLDIEILLDSNKVRWSDGKPLTAALTHFEIEPGQSKSIEMEWLVPNEIGFHNVSAIFVYRENPPILIQRPGVPLNIGACGGG